MVVARWYNWGNILPKTNSSPLKIRPSPEETSIPTIHFSGVNCSCEFQGSGTLPKVRPAFSGFNNVVLHRSPKVIELEELWRNPEDQTIQRDALQLMNVWYSWTELNETSPVYTPRKDQGRICQDCYKGVSQSEGAWSPLN